MTTKQKKMALSLVVLVIIGVGIVMTTMHKKKQDYPEISKKFIYNYF